MTVLERGWFCRCYIIASYNSPWRFESGSHFWCCSVFNLHWWMQSRQKKCLLVSRNKKSGMAGAKIKRAWNSSFPRSGWAITTMRRGGVLLANTVKLQSVFQGTNYVSSIKWAFFSGGILCHSNVRRLSNSKSFSHAFSWRFPGYPAQLRFHCTLLLELMIHHSKLHSLY